MADSRYDRLLDRYLPTGSTKKGTRYEILAALVAKCLSKDDTVVHDLKLRGDAVPHQIDVTVRRGSRERRLLIECKDYDVSGDKIDLDVARSFRSVIEDIGADEGILLTCNGFTSEALKYAKSKGIRCAVLRIPRKEDMEGRIQQIVLNIRVLAPQAVSASIHLSEDDQKLLAQACAAAEIEGAIGAEDPVFVIDVDGAKVQFNEFITSAVMEHMGFKSTGGSSHLTINGQGRSLEVGAIAISFDGIVITYDITTDELTSHVTSQRVAELILKLLDSEGVPDLFIFDDQLRERSINPDTGEIF